MKYYFNNYLYSFASELSDNIDFIIGNNPTLASEIQSLPIKYKKWLTDRFGKSPALSEIHPIQDCLLTLKKFSQRENGISAKYNSNQQFKNDIDNEFPTSDRGWLNPADSTLLSIDNMERILSLSEKKKTKIKLDTTTSYESDRIGKVGSWNIWLPSTQQNSINIAGYDPETNTEYTTWCTARIGGSNLFYNYVHPNFMLFYVIKDNPSGDNDWLSIGVLRGKIIYNGDGRESVNRDNKGLTEESLKGILGESTFEQISSIILDKYESLSGQSPASFKIQEAAKSLDKLKEMVKTNSEIEKDYFYISLLSNYEVSEEILKYLSNSKNYNVKIAVAQKTNDENLLAQLARDEDKYVRIAVAKKTNNENLLAQLASDKYRDVRIAVAYKTNNEKILEKLVLDEDPGVRMAVAKETDNEKILAQLAKDEDPFIRIEVIKKTNNENLLAQLARDEQPYVRLQVAEKTNNENLLAQLARNQDPLLRIEVAKKTNNENLLEKLAEDKNKDVRAAVAEKTNNENLLEILALDEHKEVRVQVVYKTNNKNLLVQLARDEDLSVRMAVVQKTNDENLLEILARDKYPFVRFEVAQKTNDENLLAQLARDEETSVRIVVIKKTNDENLLAQLARDKYPFIRIEVAQKTNDENLLAQLAEDENELVRDAALNKLQDLKMKAKASSNKINQILKKATLYYKLTNNYFN